MPLGMNAKMIDMRLLANFGSGLLEHPAPTTLEFGAEPVDAVVFNEECQACPRARFSKTVVAENAHNIRAQSSRFLGRHEDV